MLPVSVSVERYRAFRHRAELLLRPVTLVFGQNNAGKSALLRALPTIAHAAKTESLAPFEMERDEIGGASFSDLIFHPLDSDEDQDIVLTAGWGASPDRVAYRIKRWGERWLVSQITIHEIHEGVSSPRWTLDHTPQRADQGQPFATYTLRDVADTERAPQTSRLLFQGLMPTAVEPSAALPSAFSEVAERLNVMHEALQWLRAVRRGPERARRRPAAPVLKLTSDGANAADVLLDHPGVLASCSAFYKKHFGQHLLIEDSAAGVYRVRLRRDVRTSSEHGAVNDEVDLVDSGDGPNQLLSVLTGLGLLEKRAVPGLLVLEEPESHLHPPLQRALAEHIAQVAAGQREARVVIETHSQLFLMGIQLAVARGVLSPEDVMIHWVRQGENGSSMVADVQIDSQGGLDGTWPSEVFGDQRRLARELLRAQHLRRP